MFVVIFRAKVRASDDEYSRVAARLRELALTHFGCIEFSSVSEKGSEIALSYWRDQESIQAWKSQSEHLLAQELGRERWYDSYIVQIASIAREYRWR
ncbi:MAG: antibiotic biosynthesis monooxygenase [Polyangiaceae bacterium]|nr:antibiotic biosynthesis monooxygenase [Polyangiaceae bacterium]